MSMANAVSASAADISAIAGARHGNPFGVLGMHGTPDTVVVNVFAPEAGEVAVVDRASGEMV